MVTLTAAEDQNKSTVKLDTEGSQSKVFPPGVVDGIWSAQEWRKGTHNSKLTVNEKYTAGGTITANFNKDKWTSVEGSITQTTKSDGLLTNHTSAEGRKELIKYDPNSQATQSTTTNGKTQVTTESVGSYRPNDGVVSRSFDRDRQ